MRTLAFGQVEEPPPAKAEGLNAQLAQQAMDAFQDANITFNSPTSETRFEKVFRLPMCKEPIRLKPCDDPSQWSDISRPCDD